jgi:hypothetical protein
MGEMNMTDITQLLSKPWQKFFAKFNEIDDLKNSQWKEVHVLAYICRRYEQMYGKKFSFSFRGSPSKCAEIYMVKKIMAMLNTTNMRTIRNYIDWIFDHKIKPGNLKIRTLGFFTTPGFGNEFSLFAQEQTKIAKSTTLPKEYQEAATALDLQVATYGDLAFIKMAIDQAPECESRQPYRNLFQNLIAIGFEPAVLANLV